MSGRAFVEDLNRSYFSGELPTAFVDRLASLPVDREEVRNFVERMFRLMRYSGFDARAVSTFQADLLTSLVARLLPGTWEGRIPPITVTGRHERVDRLVKRVMEGEGRGPGTFLDTACGFPPLTTLDTAAALPGWDIIGLDREFPAYLVHDHRGNYCVFDAEGQATYFQPAVPTAESWMALLGDWSGSKARFERLLAELLDERSRRDPGRTHFEHAGAKLEVSPVRGFERANLRFIEGDFASPEAPPADVVRCFNTLLYYDDAFRQHAVEALGRLVNDGGMLVCGTDYSFTVEGRYFVYRKRDGALQPPEFAFSLDNVAPMGIVPWYTLHDDDREVNLLADLLRVLHADHQFMRRFLERSDALRAEHGLWPRGADGFYAELPPGVSLAGVWARVAAMVDRLLEFDVCQEAVEVLRRAGWNARLNEVGHLAVQLPHASPSPR